MPRRSLDPRSELVFDIHELERSAGVSRKVKRIASAPDDLGVAMIGVPPGSPIELDLLMESVVEGVLVTGTICVKLQGSCARCLEPVEYEESLDLQELYCYPGKEADDSDASRIEEDFIDLEPLLRDLVVLDLPFRPLCMPDCLGLCSNCGANLNSNPAHTHESEIDPRWAVLTGLETGPLTEQTQTN